MSFFSRFWRRPAIKASAVDAVRPLPYTRLTLTQWQASPERVAYAQELFKTPIFLDLVGMLANVRPVHTSVDATGAAILLGQRLGHDQVVATLLASAASPPAPPVDIPIDYAASNVVDAWDKEGDAP